MPRQITKFSYLTKITDTPLTIVLLIVGITLSPLLYVIYLIFDGVIKLAIFFAMCFVNYQYITVENATGQPLSNLSILVANLEFVEHDPSRFHLHDSDYKNYSVGLLKPNEKRTIAIKPQKNMSALYEWFQPQFDDDDNRLYKKPALPATFWNGFYCGIPLNNCLIKIQKQDIGIDPEYTPPALRDQYTRLANAESKKFNNCVVKAGTHKNNCLQDYENSLKKIKRKLQDQDIK